MTWRVTEPQGSTNISTGAGYIRENNLAIQNTVGVDHYYMGQTYDGKHSKVTLREVSNPTTSSNEVAIFCKDVSTISELFYRMSSNGTVVQLTSNGSWIVKDLLATSGNNNIKMSTTNGSTKVSFQDSASAEVASIDSNGNASFAGNVTVTGSFTPASGAIKAWVNFDGTTNIAGNCTIRASYNVSSVTDLGIGNYRVNFTNPISDTNYFVSGSGSQTFGNTPNLSFSSMLTTSIVIDINRIQDSGTLDPTIVCVMVIR